MAAFQPPVGICLEQSWTRGSLSSEGARAVTRLHTLRPPIVRRRLGGAGWKEPTVCTARRPTERPEGPKEGGSEEARRSIERLVGEVDGYSGDEAGRRENSVRVLNGLSEVANTVSITPVYAALVRAGRLPFFGHAPLSSRAAGQTGRAMPAGGSEVVQNERLLAGAEKDDSRPIMVTAPMQDKAVLASRLEEVTGIPPSKLSPQGPPVVVYQLGAISGLWLLTYIGRQLNIGPEIRGGVVGVVTGITIDQVLLGGVIADRVYSILNPGHVKRVVVHEAGHFLLAYLHGLPVQRYALSAWEAVKSRVPGQAATLFADDEFAGELQRGRVSASAVDRYSIVAMGGIAAEGMMLGESLGGDSDILAMVRLLAGLQPAWEANQIRVQAKWAVLQAVLLLREYRAAYDALREAMEARLSLGECVMRIEEALKDAAKEREDRVGAGEKMAMDVAAKVSKSDGVEGLEERLLDVDRKQAAVDAEIERLEKKGHGDGMADKK